MVAASFIILIGIALYLFFGFKNHLITAHIFTLFIATLNFSLFVVFGIFIRKKNLTYIFLVLFLLFGIYWGLLLLQPHWFLTASSWVYSLYTALFNYHEITSNLTSIYKSILIIFFSK